VKGRRIHENVGKAKKAVKKGATARRSANKWYGAGQEGNGGRGGEDARGDDQGGGIYGEDVCQSYKQDDMR